jgi:hypothetical protein
VRARSILAAAVVIGSMLALGTFGSTGCTIQPFGSDAGTSSGGTTTPSTETVGDECDTIASAFCMHVVDDCGFADTVADCITNELPTCCTVGSDCDGISPTTSSTLDSCTSAIAAQDCASATSDGISDLPECQGLPERP